MTQINVCRFCKIDSTQRPLFKYGPRHYACAPCGFSTFGAGGREFLDKLPTHQLGRLPYGAVLGAGWTIEQISDYTKAREARDRQAEAQRDELVRQRFARRAGA